MVSGYLEKDINVLKIHGILRSRFSWVAAFAFGCFRECDVDRGTHLRRAVQLTLPPSQNGEAVLRVWMWEYTQGFSFSTFISSKSEFK